MKRETILASPYYHLQDFQLDLFRLLMGYMEKKCLKRTDLAKELGFSKSFITQILNGEYNCSAKKLFELSLKIGYVPRIEYIPLDYIIKIDKLKSDLYEEMRENAK